MALKARESVTGTSGRRSKAEPPGAGEGDKFADFRKRSQAIVEERDKPRENPNDPYAGMSKRERKAAIKEARNLKGKFPDYPHLDALRPREGYFFHSDYFKVDGRYASILSFFHDDAAQDSFASFWGINRITAGLDDRVTTVILEQISRRGEKWVESHTKNSERLDNMDSKEQESSSSRTGKRKQQKIASDMDVIVDEIQNGASYLQVHNRLLIKAPSLEILDDSIERIRRLYIDRFGTLQIAAYPGEQRQELRKLFAYNEKKRGKGFHYTSVELAGSHSLVTNGLNDATGEYVGYMIGDVNNSAVVFDVDKYKHHVVIADDEVNEHLNRTPVPDMWGSKISQAALLNNSRAVHIVLDGADMNLLGPRLDGLTARLDMNHGDINMFELFGERKDELSIFPAHLEKIVLMAEQAYETTDSDRSVIRGELTQTLTRFYVDKQMWAYNAKENRDRLRLVGIPHDQVPRLQDIVSYFETQYKALANSTARDDEALHAYNVLRLVFGSMLSNNGDLFNTITNNEIDGVSNAQRVVYDFSKLLRRGRGVAMAQLVNVIGFAVESLSAGDTVIFHGTEYIDNGVKKYINDQLEHLYARGGRVAYLYNDIEKMLGDTDFNKFDRADYTVLGPMSDSVVTKYQEYLHQEIPPDLQRLITSKGEPLSYLRRNHANVVFYMDLALGISPARAARREELMKAADKIRGSSGRKGSSGAVKSEVGSLEEVNAQQKAVSSRGARRKLTGRNGRQLPKSGSGAGPAAGQSRARSAPTKRRMTKSG